jgi:hypothetical protein
MATHEPLEHPGSAGTSQSEREFLQDWMGEFQLPPELLEDWPWPFNSRNEGWSFLGRERQVSKALF